MAEIVCRLCVNICNDYRRLYDDHGHRTETYDVTVNYFDTSLFSEERGNHLPVMCLECWRHIIEFHNFRSSVLLAQSTFISKQHQAEVIGEPTVDRENVDFGENCQDNIVIKDEQEIVPALHVRTKHTIDHYPLQETEQINGDSEPFHGYIVKEEVDYGSPPEFEINYATYNAEYKDCTSANKNIFFTDEKELISLANTTEDISLANSVRKCKPIVDVLETKPVSTTLLDNREYSFENENIPSNDGSCIQYDADASSNYTGNVFPAGEELMDISESELESCEVFCSSDEGVHSSNDLLKKKEIEVRSHLLKQCKRDMNSIVALRKYTTASLKNQSLVATDTSQKELQTRIFSKRLAIKREKRKFDEFISLERSSILNSTFQKDMGNRIFSKTLAIKRETHKNLESKDLKPTKRKSQRSKNDKAGMPKIHHLQNEGLYINRTTILPEIDLKNKIPKSRPLKSKREEELDDVIAQWKPELECMICKNSYPTYTLLREHYREKHPIDEFYVLCCEIKIKKRGQLAEHIRLHIDPKAFKCALCDKSCTRKRNLLLHMQNKHGITDGCVDISHQGTDLTPEKQQNNNKEKEVDSDEFIAQWLPNLECVVCKTTCSSFTSLEEHFRMHHPDTECYVICCECKLLQRDHIVEHLRKHTHPRAFKCELCNRCFTMKMTLDYHIRMEHATTCTNEGNTSNNPEYNHLGISCRTPPLSRKVDSHKSDDFIAEWLPNLECGLCLKTFSSFTLLQKHFRQAHNDKAYVLCCQKKYSHREKLQEHIRKHLHPKGFKCELCGKRYSRKSGLQNHVSKQHYIGSVDDCHDNEKIPLNDGVDEDRNGNESDFLDKSIKRKTIRELDEIIAQWRPELECALCNEKCSTFTLLQNHFRQQHPNVECFVSCCQCKFPGRYDIEEHIRYHKDPNAFKCEQCGRCFSRKRALNGHIRTHRNQQQSLGK